MQNSFKCNTNLCKLIFSLTQIFDGNIEPSITLDSENPYETFDSGRGASLFDDAVAPFDGNSGTKVNAFLQVGSSTTSLNDISSFVDISQQSTIKGRFFKFRLKLTSDDNKARPEVSKMQVKLVYKLQGVQKTKIHVDKR